jgi:hypothetical protein
MADFAPADDTFDVPLRPAAEEAVGRRSGEREQPVSHADSLRAFAPPVVAESAQTVGTRERSGMGGVLVAAIAVLMLAVGFAGGWLAGSRQRVAAVPVPAAPIAAATSGRLAPDLPVGDRNARGQAVTPQAQDGSTAALPTETVRDEPTRPEPDVKTPPAVTPPQVEPSPRPQRPDAAREGPRSADTEAVLQIDSRPQGAQVYVDGRLVGRTPVNAGGLRPGEHMVRMQLPGHKDWSTAVRVAAGEHARVGGSLEEN